jgi:hypothetical protein
MENVQYIKKLQWECYSEISVSHSSEYEDDCPPGGCAL